MSQIVPFPRRHRVPTRVAMLDLLASGRPEAAQSEEEQAFVDALRQIVGRDEVLRDAYPRAHRDQRSRIFARYAD